MLLGRNMNLLVKVGNRTAQFPMEVGNFVVEMRFKDTEETEKPILPTAVFKTEGLDLPS